MMYRGERIRYYRMKAGMSQGALANRLYVSQKFIMMAEAGKVRMDEPTLDMIARGLGVKAEDLQEKEMKTGGKGTDAHAADERSERQGGGAAAGGDAGSAAAGASG